MSSGRQPRSWPDVTLALSNPFLKSGARRVYNRMIGLVPENRTPYATHIPILLGLSAAIEPKVIVEFGAGMSSTPTFLNRLLFPSVESLISFENDLEWHERMEPLVSTDSRASLTQIKGPIAAQVEGIPLNGVDLIFVDDSDEGGRTATISALAKRRPRGIPIVVHDYNLRRLRVASRPFERRFCFKIWNPQTCVLWNGTLGWEHRLKELNGLMKRNHGTPVEDTGGWREALASRSFPP